MIKSLLRLLAASSSLVALLLLTNSAIAANSIEQYYHQDSSAVVSLNLVSPTLQLAVNGHQPHFDHLGCACAVCTQAILENKSNI